MNLPGVDFQLREVQPGRYFTIGLSFPQGFHLKEGEKGELKIKSNNPNYTQIAIPITQGKAPMSPPGQPATPATPLTATPH